MGACPASFKTVPARTACDRLSSFGHGQDDDGIASLHLGIAVSDLHAALPMTPPMVTPSGMVGLRSGAGDGTLGRGDHLQALGSAVAQVNHRLNLRGIQVPEDVVGRHLAANRHVESELAVDGDVLGAVNDRANTGRPKAFRQQRAHHVVFVVLGDGKVHVRPAHRFLSQLFDVGAVAMNDIAANQGFGKALGPIPIGFATRTSTPTWASCRDRCSPMTLPP